MHSALNQSKPSCIFVVVEYFNLRTQRAGLTPCNYSFVKNPESEIVEFMGGVKLKAVNLS